jgi:hypothetical protein
MGFIAFFIICRFGRPAFLAKPSSQLLCPAATVILRIMNGGLQVGDKRAGHLSLCLLRHAQTALTFSRTFFEWALAR